MFHRLIRRWFFNPRYIIRSAFIHLEGGKGGKFAARRWYFSLFLSPEKEARRVAETVSCSRFVLPPTWFRVLTSQESPMNLQPGPSQSIVKLPRLYRTTISASLPLTLLPSLPSTSSFLTIRIPHETLRHNGVAGGRTNRPAELTTLHFYISMQNGGKKTREIAGLRIFSFFFTAANIFIGKFLYLDKFYRISRMYHETWNKTARNM